MKSAATAGKFTLNREVEADHAAGQTVALDDILGGRCPAVSAVP
jgi:hypothetical protein